MSATMQTSHPIRPRLTATQVSRRGFLAGSGAVEHRLAMLSAIEDAPAPTKRPQAPHLAVIPGGTAAEEVSEAAPETPARDDDQDLLTAILRGVRGV